MYTIAGPAFGSNAGKHIVITRALYGLKAQVLPMWRAHLASTMTDLNFTPCQADPDVWMQPVVKLKIQSNMSMCWCMSMTF